jgi:ABC-type nitrate/sulfonate/bicarbonate transport system substrate-binding protein
MVRGSGGRYTRRRFVALAGGGLAWAAAACSGPPTAAPAKGAAPAAPAPAGAPAQPAGAAPAARTTVEYGTISKTAWGWPALVAMEKGLLDRAGLDVNVTLFRTPPNGAQLFTAGSLDLGSINPETVIRSVDNGAPMVMIASDSNGAPYSLIVQPDVRSFADLRGKTFPGSGPREQTTVWLRNILKANGLEDSDFEIVMIGATPERLAALRSGAVAGALVAQPQDFQLMADGYRRLGVLNDYIPPHPISVHAGRQDWLRDHAETAVAALRALRDGVRWLYDPANKEEAIAILAREIVVAEPLARQTYEMLVEQIKLWSPDLDLPASTVQKSIDFLAQIGELTAPLPSPDKYLDRRYIEEANRAG